MLVESDLRRKVRWTGDDPVKWKDGMLGDGIMGFPAEQRRKNMVALESRHLWFVLCRRRLRIRGGIMFDCLIYCTGNLVRSPHVTPRPQTPS